MNTTTTTKFERTKALESMQAWHDAGVLILPAYKGNNKDKKKFPIGDPKNGYRYRHWRDGEVEPPSIEDRINQIRRGHSDGACILCGPCSRGLESLEVEGFVDAEVVAEFLMNVEEAGLGEVWQRIEAGVVDRTPSGGLHWYFFVDGENKGNTPLAYPEPDHPKADKCMFETRGRGGLMVASHSGGQTHPNGGVYEQIKGEGPSSIPTITVEERDAIYEAARKCCKNPNKWTNKGKSKPKEKSVHAGNRSGDEFSREVSWEMILEPLGFKKGREYYYDGETNFEWSRPGKSEGARSVVTGPERMVVFSSGTDLESNDNETGAQKSYSRFEAFVFLCFDGNFSDAASYVRRCKFSKKEWSDIASKKATPPTHTEDNREPRVYREACSLISRGIENSLDELDLFNVGECEPPLDRRDIEDIHARAKDFIEKANAAPETVGERQARKREEQNLGFSEPGVGGFFKRIGLEFEEEYLPGSWELVRVVADPVFYELIVPEFQQYGKRSERIRIELDEYTSPPKVANAIREATDGMVLVSSYPKAWAKMWIGEYEIGKKEDRRIVLGLMAKLLNKATSRTGAVTDFRSNTVFRSFMSIIDRAQQPNELDEPDESGRPRWRSDSCVWFLFDSVIQQMKRIDRTITRRDADRVLEILSRRGEVSTERFSFGMKEPKFFKIKKSDMKSLHDAAEYGLEDQFSGESGEFDV